MPTPPQDYFAIRVRGRREAHVFVGEDFVQCVGRTHKGKRCRNGVINGQPGSYTIAWVGDGILSAYEVRLEDLAQVLAQRCEVHAGPNAPLDSEPEWELADPEVHAHLLRPATLAALFYNEGEVPPVETLAAAIRNSLAPDELDAFVRNLKKEPRSFPRS